MLPSWIKEKLLPTGSVIFQLIVLHDIDSYLAWGRILEKRCINTGLRADNGEKTKSIFIAVKTNLYK
jgi:hypothetical protein